MPNDARPERTAEAAGSDRAPDPDRGPDGAKTPEAAEAPLFLTGGTGLIGSHVAELWRSRGRPVRALVRAGSDTRHLEELGCELVIGDLERPRSFRGAADGCEIAVHAAALVAEAAPWERYRAVNVEGTRHAVTECLRSGVGRLVHVSSVAVYGHPANHGPGPIGETAPVDLPVPEGAHYERSKRAAEEVVRSVAGEETGWILLRPCVVMGERDRNFTPRVARLATRSFVPLVGGGENDMAVVYAGSVAEAAWRAARHPGAVNRAFNVTDDGRLRQRRLLEIAGERLGGGGVSVPIPELSARLAVAGIEVAARLMPGTPAPPLNRRQLWFLTRDDPFDSARIREELGWSPPVSTAEGWRRTVDWYGRTEGG